MDTNDQDVISIRAERDALLNADVESWLNRIAKVASAEEYQNSLSWRVTRPLRLARTFQLRAKRDGLPSAVSQAAVVVKQRIARR